MTQKTIDQLTDGDPTRDNTAVMAFEQGGATFKGTVIPNSSDTHFITSQVQLESIFGTDLEIPNGTRANIYFLNDITFTKPIKCGNNTTVILAGTDSVRTLTLDAALGTSPFLQHITPTDITNMNIDQLTIVGTTVQVMFDLNIDQLFRMDRSQIFSVASLGKLVGGFFLISNSAFVSFSQGLILESTAGTNFAGNSIVNIVDIPIFTIISPVAGLSFTFRDVQTPVFSSGSFLVFLDPNSGSTVRYLLTDISVPVDQLFQLGTDITVNSAALGTSGAGFTEFTTASPHGLIAGQAVVNSTFSDSAYNGTFIVVAIPSTTIYEVETTFTATGAGNMNESSLDQTDIIVIAQNNPNNQDSMFLGESGLTVFGSEISTSSLAQNAFEVVTSASWVYGDTERISQGVATQGQLVVDDTTLRRYRISYSGTLEKSGGGSVNIGVLLLKNGAISSFEPPHTVNTGKIQINGSDIIELTSTDTIDIAVINYAAAATVIDVSQLNIAMNKA